MMSNIRPSGRAHDQLRPVSFIRNYTHHAEGSVLACFGETKVLCTASISETLPRFLQNSHQGWLTAEYGMLPRSTHERIDREAAHGKQKGRTIEIQRLIGRALRAGIDLKALGPRMIVIDCDVIQADGGTRTAAISGACVALVDALNFLVKQGRLNKIPLRHLIAAVSVGIYNQTPILDLEYREDSKAHTDMNIVMTETGHFVELQGTAENQTFSTEELNILLELGRKGTNEIIQAQKESLGLSYSIINGA